MDEEKTLLSNIFSLGDWATWKTCLDRVEEGLQVWASKTRGLDFRRVYLAGCGSSSYGGQVGKWIVEHIARLPAEAKQAFSFANYMDPGLFASDILVVGLSTTGNTEAACEAMAFARQNGATTLAITAAPDSQITRIAESTIYTGGHVSVIVQTETYVQSLLALYLLSLSLAERENQTDSARPYWHNQFRTAREITHQFLEFQGRKITDLVEAYGSLDNFFILGNGPNAGTAEEAALKVIELAKMYSDGGEMEDFFHGRDRELDKDTAVFYLAPQSHRLNRVFDLLTFNRKTGVPSIVITCQDIAELTKLAYHAIVLQGSLDEYATPLVYITPLYLFSYQLALKRGYDPLARRYPFPALKVRYRGSEYDQSSSEVRNEI